LNQLSEGEVLGDDFDIEEEIESTESGGMVEMAQPKEEANPTMPTKSAEPENESDE